LQPIQQVTYNQDAQGNPASGYKLFSSLNLPDALKSIGAFSLTELLK
jgi:hypothetical protein